MSQFAYLHLLEGKCNSLGAQEFRFRYPLKTDHEKDLHKKAMDKITRDAFQVGFFWSLVEASRYKEFVQACAGIPGGLSEPVIVPEYIMHGEIIFAVQFRFDGYGPSHKERLVQKIVDTGLHPSQDSLDFTYRHVTKEIEILTGGAPNPENLANEERATFARNLTFHTE